MTINKISDELLAAYIDGNITQQEADQINQCFQNNPAAFAEYCLASKAAFLSEDEPDAETKQLTSGSSWNIAAGIASAISSGTGISGLISHLNQSTSFMDNQESFSVHDDRFDNHTGSIPENSNHLVMDNYFHTAEFNPVQQQYNDTCAIKSQPRIGTC